MTSPREESSVPEPTSSAEAIERVADLPPADAGDKAADVRGGFVDVGCPQDSSRHRELDQHIR
jgi:hypothetical protein